ncbi:hypothetical protein [Pseudomonas sp. RIT-To-2]|uniref:hypothetical protein n=1 Tax=Pseudomonas sp. RIT-To-2 TaxID=3462541 RepID=UPI0024131374
MTEVSSFRQWLGRYLLVFMGVIFMGCFSLGAAVAMVANALGNVHQRAIYGWLACLALGAVLVHINLFIVLGWRNWAGVMAAFFVACLLAVLAAFDPGASRVMVGGCLLWPVIGLLLLNSKRHREMRAGIQARRQRRLLRRSA